MSTSRGVGFNRKLRTRVRPGFRPRCPQRPGVFATASYPLIKPASYNRHALNRLRRSSPCVCKNICMYATRQRQDEFNISRTAVVRSTTAAAELIKAIACAKRVSPPQVRPIYVHRYTIYTQTLVTCILSDSLTHLCVCVCRNMCLYILECAARICVYLYVYQYTVAGYERGVHI